MKKILLTIILFQFAEIISAQTNETPQLLYADSINKNSTNKTYKAEIAVKDSLVTSSKQNNPISKSELKYLNNNKNDSLLYIKKENEIED